MERIHTLFAAEGKRGRAVLPAGLRAIYGGDLRFPRAPRERPYVAANFVSTMDGVVSFQLPGRATGAEISGRNPADRFLMGLLRASADAVIVGAGTFRDAGPRALWLPEFIFPAARSLYRRLREDVLGKPKSPLVVIVSGAGRVDLKSAVFRTKKSRALILTTEDGKRALERQGANELPALQVAAMRAKENRLAAPEILGLLRHQYGVEMAVHEGGPHLFGDFLASGNIDELFLTVAPQIAGRNEAQQRPGLAGFEFSPENAPWSRLISAKRAGDFLYLRYRIIGAKASGARPG